MGYRTTRFAAAAVGLTLVAGLPPAAIAADAPTFQSVLDAAKAENALVVRLSSPGKPETAQALVKAFNERFGLSVEPDWAPANAPVTNTRVITEASGGQGSIDIVGLGSAEDVAAMSERGLVKAYPWAEVFGKELPGIDKAVAGVMPELRGKAMVLLDAVYGLGWNPALIDEAALPAKLADLADPSWEGRIALNSAFLNPVPTLDYVVGAEDTVDLAKRILTNKPVLERGTPAVSRAIAVGQVPIGITTFHSAKRTMQGDKPQSFRLFEDYIPIFQAFVYVPETAPHPAMARLFLAWLVTEGVAIADKLEPLPSVSAPGSEIGALVEAQQATTGAKIASPETLAQAEGNAAVRDRIAKLISSGN